MFLLVFLACLFYLHLKSTPVLFCTSILLIATYVQTMTQNWAVLKNREWECDCFWTPAHSLLKYTHFGVFQKWLIPVYTWMNNFTFTSCCQKFAYRFWTFFFNLRHILTSQPKFSNRLFDRWTSLLDRRVHGSRPKKGKLHSIGNR